MIQEITGICWKFGDNIPTDQIVRVDRALGTLEEMAKHVLEDLNHEFPQKVKKGDILVAGKHFGQSSGRAVAPKAIKAIGISVVIVEYASRLFYRNCFEIGLPLLECPGISNGVMTGDKLCINFENYVVTNLTNRMNFTADKVDPFLMRMLECGGLIELAPFLEEMS